MGKPDFVSILITCHAIKILNQEKHNIVVHEILRKITEFIQKIFFFAEVMSKKLDFSGTFDRKTAKKRHLKFLSPKK